MSAQSDFNAAYWASQLPQVQALQNMDPATKLATAEQLAQQGFIIDVAIMAEEDFDPYNTMLTRITDGMTWIPAALQPSIGYLEPGQTPNPPFVPYDPTKRPAGSIKVSANIADYPPFNPPAPTPPPATNMVGPLSIGNSYAAGPGAMVNSQTPAVTDGQQVTQDGATYTAHVAHGLMGIVVYFTKNA